MSVKSEVLLILENNREKSISGNEIAEIIGVSRNSVWKAVKQLRDEGYSIEAVTNKGYCLKSSNIMSAEGISTYLKTKCLGHKIIVLKEIDSTNNYAKILALKKEPHGTLVVADMQTMGKGRMARPFFSPSGSGVYMTLILRPQFTIEQSVMITSSAAVAVARAIEKLCGVNAKIKWVNDIFIGDKKVCGILTEAGIDFETQNLDYAVTGIGINVYDSAFPKELSNIATSLMSQSKKSISRNQLIAEVLNDFELLYNELDKKTFLEEYISRSNLIGKTVTVFEGTQSYTASVISIDENARLIVRTNDGTQKALNSGEVSIKKL